MKNMFCDSTELHNEAEVEARFVNPLIAHLGYTAKDVKLKTSIKEYRIGTGSKSVNYKPDYIIDVEGLPTLVIDAKNPSENVEDWTQQCSSYCLELNKLYTHNPVKYFILTNGNKTILYKWDQNDVLISLDFKDFDLSNPLFNTLLDIVSKVELTKEAINEKEELLNSSFKYGVIDIDELTKLFSSIHQYIWTEEKKTPSAAFTEFLKIIFIKIQKDKDITERFGKNPQLKVKDVVFSKEWISLQTEHTSPINDPLFKNLLRELEREIRDKNKKRFFDEDEEINLSPRTIERIVERLQHIDLYSMDEDVHGRIFESFLDATVRGKELGQYFTPRDVVKLMVELSDPGVKVKKEKQLEYEIDNILDACCGSGGFLISAFSHLMKKVDSFVGLSDMEKKIVKNAIRLEAIYGIDAGSDPAIYRIARMNMYLHGDGGSNIFFADSLDKSLGRIGRHTLEYDAEINEIREIFIKENKKFDIILSNPPFSLKYEKTNKDEKAVLDQYELAVNTKSGKELNSLLSSVMFIERYKDLVEENGKIFAIIDDSVLSGEKYDFVRDYIRKEFIIVGIISLPGDAFRRSAARVKTSILILKPKQQGEEQTEVFMAKSTYLGLPEKIAKRIGINKSELVNGQNSEIEKIVSDYKNFISGMPGDYVVTPDKIKGRLDVKYCFNDNGRKKSLWKSKDIDSILLDDALKVVNNNKVTVEEDEEYQFLKVNYSGEVLDGDLKAGEDCSYSTLQKVKPWDILYSNMGVGRGAIGIVPPYHEDKFVSSEYTILNANSKEEAIYYTEILRTKEILGDVLSSTTGMNRGRIKWSTMSKVEVPKYDSNKYDLSDNVKVLESYWESRENFFNTKKTKFNLITSELELNTKDARNRWLAVKPPE